MNSIRIIIGNVFSSEMGNMSFVRYFNYINEAGKVTARSLMNVVTVLLTFAEEQERKNEEYDNNFKEIEKILTKLTSEKLAKPAIVKEKEIAGPIEPTLLTTSKEIKIDPVVNEGFICKVCSKTCASKLGLISHSRSHSSKNVV